MAEYWLDEDLTTGSNDGSSAANAWQAWATMIAGVGTMAEDVTVNIASTGTVALSRSLSGITRGGYTLALRGYNNCILLDTTGYTAALTAPNIGTGHLDVRDIKFLLGANVSGFSLAADYIGTATGRNLVSYGNGVVAANGFNNLSAVDWTLEHCIAVNVTYAFRISAIGDMMVTNCYGSAATQVFYVSGTGAFTLTTCASSDTTGSAGLQSIAFSTANFTSVTIGAEDFHLVSGSALIGVGTVTSDTLDFNGDTWGTPRDLGIYTYSTGSTGIPILRRRRMLMAK